MTDINKNKTQTNPRDTSREGQRKNDTPQRSVNPEKRNDSTSRK